MPTDAQVNAHVLYAATVRQLDSFAERVAENRDVLAALDFARYVLNSGLVKVLAPLAGDGFLKVDASFLQWKAQELQRGVQERLRPNDTKPHLEALQLQSLNQKLDTIAGYLSKLTVQGGAVLPASPTLNVIEGGLNDT
jgi:membrane protease subunit (stomatin/prohibitin family)